MANRSGSESCAVLNLYINRFGVELIKYQSCGINQTTQFNQSGNTKYLKGD